MTPLRTFVLSISLLTGFLCNSAMGAYIDLTDSTTVGSLSGSGNSYTGTVDGVGFSLTSSNGAITFNQSYDGDKPSAWCQPAGTLACDKDGIGIADDELAGEQAQTLSLIFDVPVYVHSLEFLDLYDNSLNGKGTEQAKVSINGTDYFVDATGTSGDGGYARLDLLSLVGPIQSILFSANIHADLRDDNTNDYAFAAATVSAVPIPAAVWLFGTALIGLIGFRRRSNAI